MSATLLEQFLKQECNDDVRRLIRNGLDDPSSVRKRFEFNRFEVTIDREQNVVLLEDVLDNTDAGAAKMSIAEFEQALNSGPA